MNNVVSMDSQGSKKCRVYFRLLTLAVSVMAWSGTPLLAQAFAGIENESCIDASWISPALIGERGDRSVVAATILPSLSSFIVEADMQTVTGRLTCADPRPAFYNCGHTKQSVWGCKPDCFMDWDGSQYVLQVPGKTYYLTGDLNQIRRYLAEQVSVTGELKGDTIKAVSITKGPKKQRSSGMRPENGTP